MDRDEQKVNDSRSPTTHDVPLQDLPPEPLDTRTTDHVRGGGITMPDVKGESMEPRHKGTL